MRLPYVVSVLALLAAALVPEAGCAWPAHSGELMVCHVLATDVRRERAESSLAYEHDPAQETQLLYGELVRAFETVGGWRRIAAVEQPEYTHHRRWEGYPGWVKADTLLPAMPAYQPNLVVIMRYALVVDAPQMAAQPKFPVAFGTRLVGERIEGEWWRLRLADGTTGFIHMGMVQALDAWNSVPLIKRRLAIVKSAGQLVGDPYRWGGRSPLLPFVQWPLTGTDCSGLVHLAYRVQGLEIPRDAQEQFLKSRKLPARELQPGDVIFLSAAGRPREIIHVMLYDGMEDAIEGPGTGEAVRRVKLAERLGPAWRTWASGAAQVGGQTVYFGSLMEE